MEDLLNPKKVLWAIDPFAENPKLQRSAAWAIHQLAQPDLEEASPLIQPIYLVNDASSIVPQRLIRSYLKKIQVLGEDSLHQIVRRIPIRNLNSLEVIAEEFISLQDGAKALLSYAKRNKFDFIVASTHSRQGTRSESFFPGSFVETILDQTQIPSLVVNPKWRFGHGVDRLVFPTDFSLDSQRWFDRLIEFANKQKFKITLFYQLEIPLSQPFDKAVKVFPELRELIIQKIKRFQTEGRKWMETGKRKGVNVSLFISSDLKRAYTTSFQACLERYHGLAVLAPPISSIFSHSGIRRLLGKSPFPILWVPESAESEIQKPGIPRLRRIA